VSTTSLLNVFGIDFHADFQRGPASEVDCCQRSDRLTDSNGSFEDNLIDALCDYVIAAASRDTGVSDFVQHFHHLATVNVASEVYFVRRHQDGHRETFFALRKFHFSHRTCSSNFQDGAEVPMWSVLLQRGQSDAKQRVRKAAAELPRRRSISASSADDEAGHKPSTGFEILEHVHSHFGRWSVEYVE